MQPIIHVKHVTKHYEFYRKEPGLSGTLKALVRVPREHVKRIAADMIASSLPIDDILIEEMPVDDIVRAIFKDAQG